MSIMGYYNSLTTNLSNDTYPILDRTSSEEFKGIMEKEILLYSKIFYFHIFVTTILDSLILEG